MEGALLLGIPLDHFEMSMGKMHFEHKWIEMDVQWHPLKNWGPHVQQYIHVLAWLHQQISCKVLNSFNIIHVRIKKKRKLQISMHIWNTCSSTSRKFILYSHTLQRNAHECQSLLPIIGMSKNTSIDCGWIIHQEYLGKVAWPLQFYKTQWQWIFYNVCSLPQKTG